MSTQFYNNSRKIASDFLQNIVFIDDKAFENNESKGKHDFDAYAVTKAFASHKKICAVYKPKINNDIFDLAQLAKRADVTVLDWHIELSKEIPSAASEEEEEEIEDPRGQHTLHIIREILSDPIVGKGSLKLIVIYTGEVDLDSIANTIHTDLESIGIKNIQKSFCELCTDNIKIIVIAKSDPALDAEGRTDERYTHSPNLAERVKSYDQLPDYIIDRFSSLTNGLLPNFALKALTIIRENTFMLLSKYNKDLDPAFVTHRLLLPDQEDSKELLVELFAHSLHSLLLYNSVNETVNTDEVVNWIDTQKFEFQIPVSSHVLSITNEDVKTWVSTSFIEMCSRIWEANNYGTVSKKIKDEFTKTINSLPAYFISGDRDNKFDKQFSILTHHKSIFKPNPISPKLTLGTVIKGIKSNTYWVCIQQRCDSVRIKDVRKFLFLPLEIVRSDSNELFHFITDDGIRLRLQKKSYSIRTIKFQVQGGDKVINALKHEDKFLFEPYYKEGRREYEYANDESYEWIFDLKDLHAQRIVIDFTTQLARVGVDESEWLRRGYTR
ncbi:MAG: hypothetical protein EOP52_05440 [Sphingobacteriales bacterium]|nr:MAG: hypothetical protein EOP52_05440 [Sphingobacteriales bacterium]